MATVVFTILPIIPLVAWLLLVGWSPGNAEGEVLLTVPVPLLARIKMLWIPFLFSVTVVILSLLFGNASWWILLVLVTIYVIVLAIPVGYTLTTVGIRTGRGVFRRWTEFAGVRRSSTGAILQGGPRSSSYPIFLSGNREDDEFVLTLKTLIQDSYKGRAINRDRIRNPGTHSDGETSTTSSINH